MKSSSLPEIMRGNPRDGSRSDRPPERPSKTRQLLSGASTMTVAMTRRPTAMIAGIATAPIMVVDGRPMPGAKVQMKVGSKTVSEAHADSSGQYQLKQAMPLKAGTYQVKVKASRRPGASRDGVDDRDDGRRGPRLG